MSYLIIDVARTIDEDRLREAATCQRINQALRVRQNQPTHPVQVLAGWLRGVMKRERHLAAKKTGYAFPLPHVPAR